MKTTKIKMKVERLAISGLVVAMLLVGCSKQAPQIPIEVFIRSRLSASLPRLLLLLQPSSQRVRIRDIGVRMRNSQC